MKKNKIKFIMAGALIILVGGITTSAFTNNKVKASDVINTSSKEIVLSDIDNKEDIKENASQSGQEDFIVNNNNGFHDPDSKFTFDAYQVIANAISDIQIKGWVASYEERDKYYNDLLEYFTGLNDGKDASKDKAVIDSYYILMGTLLPENYHGDKLSETERNNISESLYKASTSLESLK